MAYGCQTPSAQRRSDQFPLTPMGVLAPGSAHARPSAQPPIDMSGNFPLLFFFSCYHCYSKPQKGLSYCFKFLHGLLSNKNIRISTFKGVGEMFEGHSADTCAGKFPLVSMGDRAEGLACADPGARTPIGASGNFFFSCSCCCYHRYSKPHKATLK